LRVPFARTARQLDADRSFDPWIYRFVLSGIVLAILAVGLHLVLTLHSSSGNLLPYAGTPIGLVLLSTLAFILWRGSHTLHFVLRVLYVVVTMRITLQLIYVLVSNKPGLEFHFLWTIGWMSVDYLLPFLIFRMRTATTAAIIAFAVWLSLSGVYVVGHLGMEQGRGILIVLSQTYLAQAIQIVFMTVYARLRWQYTLSQKMAHQMERVANTDFLLGTANRRAIQAELERALIHTVDTGTWLSIVLIDIDHFKEINDTYGHSTGDNVLIEITTLLSSWSHPLYHIGRWGGEEFLIILPNSNGTESYRWAQQIRAAMETSEFSVSQVTASFGIAEYQVGDSLSSLLKRADEALYKCKKEGRNRVELAD
jgi:diguanylate cyclase (GGDEF)-like protein